MKENKKPARSIFQPDAVTAKLIKEYQEHHDGSTISDFVNAAIFTFFQPYNENLRIEFQRIIVKIRNGETPSNLELKSSLANAVLALQNHPVSDYSTLQQICIHFDSGLGWNYHFYEYVTTVNDAEDNILRQLNEAIKTLDPNYVMGKRELGERTRDVFENWEELCHYKNTYLALSIIINNEKTYLPLNVIRVLDLIKRLDNDIYHRPAELLGDNYPSNVTIEDQINAISYAINIYQCDNGYVAISGDHDFKKLHNSEFKDYENEWVDYHYCYKQKTEQTLAEMKKLEDKGSHLLRELARQRKQEDNE